jgi:hypothetical protein
MESEKIESTKVRLNEVLNKIEGESIEGLFRTGLDALDKPSQLQVVTSTLQKIKNEIRDRSYPNRDKIIDGKGDVGSKAF